MKGPYGGRTGLRWVCWILGRHRRQNTGWLMRSMHCGRCGEPAFLEAETEVP